MDKLFNKVYGSLAGLVIGDVMGMPSEFMTPAQIRKQFVYIDAFCDPPEDHIHPDLRRGQITDDSEQSIYLIEQYNKDKMITVENTAKALQKWAQETDAFNKSYIGPSTAKALRNIEQGQNPRETGFAGFTCGSAMRVVPVGLINAGNFNGALKGAINSSLPTHGTDVAISAAAAVACGISSAMDGKATLDSVIDGALRGAREGAKQGKPAIAASIEDRTRLALSLVNNIEDITKAGQVLYDHIGCGMDANEVVPVVLALFYVTKGDPMQLIRAGANIGGDTDTIAALGGALGGAFHGIDHIDADLLKEAERINNLNVKELAKKIVGMIGMIK
ncbi:ADP-ribosylglycohydrolase family protein [bacterium]|nr:ADP-ribosylglycohydrolase family protein [bacterium]MBU1634098.1 ADP-ribosylglycohydrolase family protein [bacterium]MBU1872537.1 ADP-ribosylglycohydrolase family protein [bacterium]